MLIRLADKLAGGLFEIGKAVWDEAGSKWIQSAWKVDLGIWRPPRAVQSGHTNQRHRPTQFATIQLAEDAANGYRVAVTRHPSEALWVPWCIVGVSVLCELLKEGAFNFHPNLQTMVLTVSSHYCCIESI